MLGPGFLFLDVFMNETRHRAASKTAGRFELRFAFRIAHETPIKWFFGADVIVIIESQLAAFATL